MLAAGHWPNYPLEPFAGSAREPDSVGHTDPS